MTPIRTRRLEGRPVTPRDWPLFVDVLSRPSMTRWLRPAGPPDADTAARDGQATARRFAENWASDGVGPRLWRLGARPVGYAGLRRSQLDGRMAWEALWGVLPDYQGRGFATEAMAAVLAEEAEAAGLVLAWTLPENAASRRVMEKLGMTFEGRADWKGYEHIIYRLDR